MLTKEARMRLRFALALALGTACAGTVAMAQKGDTPAPQSTPAPATPAPAQGATPAQAPLAPMLAHRAAYRLTLDRARDNSNVVSARGAMIYEQADACDGWATRQRFQLTLTDRDGNEVETTSDYSTYEAKDGRSLRFSLTQTSQGAVSQRIQGDATLNADGTGTVRYTSPEAREMALPPGTLLPMLHTTRSLQAARAGQRIMIAPLFDGTSADGAQDTTTAITGWTGPQNNARFPILSPLGSARMRVAFFNREPGGQSAGTGSPDYEVGLRYWENGVADEMKMDFGDFTVNGEMIELQPIPAGC
nr:cell envelope integrity EipB family protein [Roseomonas acroporae]